MLAAVGDLAVKRGPGVLVEQVEGDQIDVFGRALGDLQAQNEAIFAVSRKQRLNWKSAGKLRRFYGYLLGDNLNPFRLGDSYTQFPDNRGWFGTQRVRNGDGATIGSLYSEILFYKDIVDRASKRLEVYKKRIGLKF
jgi:hypothetical protein